VERAPHTFWQATFRQSPLGRAGGPLHAVAAPGGSWSEPTRHRTALIRSKGNPASWRCVRTKNPR
jgi:hypothetical protein